MESGVRHPPHQQRRTTNNVGERRIVAESGGAGLVAHSGGVVVLVGERRDGVEAASPRLRGLYCLVARVGDLGSRTAEGDALTKIHVVEGRVVATPRGWVRPMHHDGGGGEGWRGGECGGWWLAGRIIFSGVLYGPVVRQLRVRS